MGKEAARWWHPLWLVWMVVARLTWLGTLSGGWSTAYGVSADGSVVVGEAQNAAGLHRAFRWTASGGMEDLNITYAHLLTNGSKLYRANAISPDGRYVVGIGYNAATRRIEAFLLDTQWTGVEERLTWLGTLGGGGSLATGVSADGSVVVGVTQNVAGKWPAFGSVVVSEAWNAAWRMPAFGSLAEVFVEAWNAAWKWKMRAFRWTAAGGMQNLGTPPGSDDSMAHGVSADGSVVVGCAENAAGQQHAFHWTAAGGMQNLGTLGGWESVANAVSADGSVVVGAATNAAGKWRAFRWTAAHGMQDLGTLGGDRSEAYGVSADGSVVVGWAENAAGQDRAFRWTAAGGMEDLNITYAHLLTDGSELREAYAISPDGRYIVGLGYNAATGREEAFLLDTQGTGVEEGSGAAGVRLRLLPQPAHERVALELEVAKAARGVTLVVTDALGRVVAEPLRKAVLPPGVHRVELDVRAWAAGQYKVVLRTKAGSTAVLLAVVR
jgi:probable HAF family extracellular repeat protein